MRSYVLAAVTVLGLAGLATQSEAATLSARVFEDDVQQVLSGASTPGALLLQGVTANFSQININAFGTPNTPEPSLIGQTTQISSASTFSGTHTLRIEVTQSGLNSATAGGLLGRLSTTLTANLLLRGESIRSVTISTFVDANDTPFATTTLLATNTYTNGSPVAAGPFFSSVSLGNPLFSETLVISATFTGGGAALQTSSQIAVGAPPVTVPEPASIALFSTGLIAMGMVARRRRQG